MNWTHHICLACWQKTEGNRVPHRVLPPVDVKCCICGQVTWDSIYVRRNPKSLICDCKDD